MLLYLIPFTTSWVGENYNEPVPILAYGAVLWMNAIAYLILQNQIIKFHGEDFSLKQAISQDRKGKISMGFYTAGIALSFIDTGLAIGCYVAVAIMWFIPDRRIEKNM